MNLTCKEEFHLGDLEGNLSPHQEVTLAIVKENGSIQKSKLISRFDTSSDIEYYLDVGIFALRLRQLAQKE